MDSADRPAGAGDRLLRRRPEPAPYLGASVVRALATRRAVDYARGRNPRIEIRSPGGRLWSRAGTNGDSLTPLDPAERYCARLRFERGEPDAILLLLTYVVLLVVLWAGA